MCATVTTTKAKQQPIWRTVYSIHSTAVYRHKHKHIYKQRERLKARKFIYYIGLFLIFRFSYWTFLYFLLCQINATKQQRKLFLLVRLSCKDIHFDPRLLFTILIFDFPILLVLAQKYNFFSECNRFMCANASNLLLFCLAQIQNIFWWVFNFSLFFPSVWYELRWICK